jgi:hypothetical protein
MPAALEPRPVMRAAVLVSGPRLLCNRLVVFAVDSDYVFVSISLQVGQLWSPSWRMIRRIRVARVVPEAQDSPKLGQVGMLCVAAT